MLVDLRQSLVRALV